MSESQITHPLVVNTLMREFPGFKVVFERSLANGCVLERGVVLIDSLPERGQLAYMHYIYPPIAECDTLWVQHFGSPMPSQLKTLFKLMNGATLFHNLIEFWGFRVDNDDFKNPAYDIRHKNEINTEWFYFGSTNCGDVISLNEHTGNIRLQLLDEDTYQDFPDINAWLVSEGEIGYEIFEEHFS